MKKKILWLSQHKPLPIQLSYLPKYLNSEVEVVPDPKPFSSAEEIVKRYRAGNYDDMVVVAPMSVISRLIDLGIKPLWAEMQVVPDQSAADVTAKGRHYKFMRWRRIIALNFKFEDEA